MQVPEMLDHFLSVVVKGPSFSSHIHNLNDNLISYKEPLANRFFQILSS
jgi:hypothetical protein